MRYLLGIDIATSGTKTLLISEDGNVIASAVSEYQVFQPQNGWVEQNPEDWWQATQVTIRKVIKDNNIDIREIISIGLTGQMHGLVILDNEGNVLRPSIIWCDQRAVKQRDEVRMHVGTQRLLLITANPASTIFTAAKLLWVREHEPDIYEKCYKILLPKDYIRYKLTGEFATDVSDASGMQMLDVANRCWSSDVLSALQIDRNLLGEVHESHEVTGHVTKEAAERTGLAEGTIVVAGAGDNAAAAVGMGVVKEGKAFTTIENSGVVFAHSDKPVFDEFGRVYTFCCAIPGAWHIVGFTQCVGLLKDWFWDLFCQSEVDTAKVMNKSTYDLMDDMAAQSPIGANRLIFLPYLIGDRTPYPYPDYRGVFFGLSAMHTKNDLLRAVIEGVAYSLKDCYNTISGIGIEEKNMPVYSKGGSNLFWRQMVANVLGCPVSTTHMMHGPAFGAAILAGVGANIFASVQGACDKLIKPQEQIFPDIAASKKYSKIHSVYRGLYPQLVKNFQALNEL